MERRLTALVLILILALGLILPQMITAEENTNQRDSVCLVYDIGGRGDLSFNDMAYLGAQMAKEKLGLKIVELHSHSQDDYLPNLRTLAKEGKCVVIVGVGFLMTDSVRKVAGEYPDQLFAIIDGWIPNMSNVLSVTFRENEGSALAGALAALIAINHDATKVGVVLGMEIPVLYKFEAGYRYGVKWAVEWYKQHYGEQRYVEVLYQYTGTFSDPAKGKEAANAQLNQGAIVVYNVAGATGLGIFDAVEEVAKQAGKDMGPPYAIGVDADQDYIKPGFIIASMMKRVDVGVYDAAEKALKYINGEIDSYGGVLSLGVKENGTLISTLEDLDTFMQIGIQAGVIKPEDAEDIKNKVGEMRNSEPSWIWSAVEELETKIRNGEVQVPMPMDKNEMEQLREELAVPSPTPTTTSPTTTTHTPTTTTTISPTGTVTPTEGAGPDYTLIGIIVVVILIVIVLVAVYMKKK